MTNLLSNPLVQKYFGFDNNHEQAALRILRAREQPIKKGEKYLCHRRIPDMFWETVYEGEQILGDNEFHPYALRLPDRFQCRCSLQDICYQHPEMARNMNQPAKDEEKPIAFNCKVCDTCQKPMVALEYWNHECFPRKPSPSATATEAIYEEKLIEHIDSIKTFPIELGMDKGYFITASELNELVALARRKE